MVQSGILRWQLSSFSFFTIYTKKKKILYKGVTCTRSCSPQANIHRKSSIGFVAILLFLIFSAIFFSLTYLGGIYLYLYICSEWGSRGRVVLTTYGISEPVYHPSMERGLCNPLYYTPTPRSILCKGKKRRMYILISAGLR